MRKIMIDFALCPGNEFCSSCETLIPGIIKTCKEGNYITLPANDWPTAELICKLKARCAYNAIEEI